jgi:hypothetical protein
MTAENDPVDTIAVIALVPRSADTRMIGPPAERGNHGAGPQIARSGQEETVPQNGRNVLKEIGRRRGENGLGGTDQPSDLARRAPEDIAVIETDMIAAAEKPVYAISMLVYLPAANETPYTQGFVLSTGTAPIIAVRYI